MTPCATCGASLSESDRFCGLCGTATDTSDEVTRAGLPDTEALTVAPTAASMATPRPVSRPASGSSYPSHPSWLSTPDVSHGRFPPGSIIADRYRIVGRLGQGGMGEVYRADDLKLGQAVALKFLPPALETEPMRLAQFHNEVRLARQIAHKNVCRMYDVGDADGLPFMTMEYVDGEDLASLLRRIGRLPEDKALELAHQLCAGLAAAHERGVLHRDLKPANVMIDGAGEVRITDFGLAAIEGTANTGHAGTPAYMAPELLAGKDPSVQSDLFALGLVLYELFTGRRAYTAQTLRDLVRQQNESTITPPRSVVKDLDPVIERTIIRCLERDPADRPRSALAVAGALPGGDPLAAALAAGETPSPEMVAEAGQQAAATRAHAVMAGGAVILLLILCAAVSLQNRTLRQMNLDKPPAVLVDRAHQVLDTLGYGKPTPHTWWQVNDDMDLVREAADHPETLRGHDVLTSRPGPLLFSWRSSPRALVPVNDLGAVSMDDPPIDVTGMTVVVTDMSGRLVKFQAVPPQVDASTATPAAPDWTTLFTLAGLNLATFQPATPTWLPPDHADTRAAWTGPMPDGPGQVRVEAAAWKGKPTYFQIVMPWTLPEQMEEPPQTVGARLLNGAEAFFTLVLLTGAMWLAHRNLKAGRGDWTGATRLAITAVVGQLIASLLTDPYVGNASQDIGRFFNTVGQALFSGGVLFVMYLAAEPTIRYYWPDTLLGFTRLLRGRVVDTRVARDVLIGLAAGAFIQLVIWARDPLEMAMGASYPAMSTGNTAIFLGPGYALGQLAEFVTFQAVFSAMWCILAIAGLKRLLKKKWLVGVVATSLLTLVAGRNLFIGAPGIPWVNLVSAFLIVGVIAVLAIRAGLLSTAMALFATYVLSSMPWTLDTGAWYFPQSALALTFLVGLAAFAGYAMSAGSAERPPVKSL